MHPDTPAAGLEDEFPRSLVTAAEVLQFWKACFISHRQGGLTGEPRHRFRSMLGGGTVKPWVQNTPPQNVPDQAEQT